MARIETADQLFLAASNGYKVKCQEISYLEKGVEAGRLLGLSLRSIHAIIKKGLECDQIKTKCNEDDLLYGYQAKIKALGLSTREIARRVGVSQQAVSKFLTAESVQTQTLERYLRRLGLK